MIVLIRRNIDGWYEAVCRDCRWRSEPGTWRDACLAKAGHGSHSPASSRNLLRQDGCETCGHQKASHEMGEGRCLLHWTETVAGDRPHVAGTICGCPIYRP